MSKRKPLNTKKMELNNYPLSAIHPRSQIELMFTSDTSNLDAVCYTTDVNKLSRLMPGLDFEKTNDLAYTSVNTSLRRSKVLAMLVDLGFAVDTITHCEKTGQPKF